MAQNTVERLTNTKKNIDFHKPTLTKEELSTVLDCLVEDLVTTGDIVEKFEKDFKSTFGLRNVVSTNNLFSAYHLSLLALGIGEGDPVLLSTYAPSPALHAVLLLKAKPIPVDLGRSSFHMDEEQFSKKIVEFQPKVILVDHTFGCLFDIKKYGVGEIPIIEDYSEALGADSDDISVGKQGVISICGLAPHHVITTGNGAIMVTQNDAYAEQLRFMKYGAHIPPKKKAPLLQFDYNLIDFQAAMGIEQISKLGVFIERKKKIAQVYLQAVLAASHETYFKRASKDQFNRFPVVVAKPFDEVDRYFKSLLIGTEKTISEPIHRALEMQNNEFPNAERLFQRGHLIPIYPNLSKDNVSRIANSLKGLY